MSNQRLLQGSLLVSEYFSALDALWNNDGVYPGEGEPTGVDEDGWISLTIRHLIIPSVNPAIRETTDGQ